MSKEVMAECVDEAVDLLERYAASRSEVVHLHLLEVATIAVALYQERMRQLTTVNTPSVWIDTPSASQSRTKWVQG